MGLPNSGQFLKLYGDIYKDLRKEKMKPGDPMIGDAIIMASYRQIPLPQLLKIQFLIGKIIKEKKEQLKIIEAQKDGNKPTDTDKPKEDVKPISGANS